MTPDCGGAAPPRTASEGMWAQLIKRPQPPGPWRPLSAPEAPLSNPHCWAPGGRPWREPLPQAHLDPSHQDPHLYVLPSLAVSPEARMG